MGGDSFASANSSPPIRISRDTQNKLFNTNVKLTKEKRHIRGTMNFYIVAYFTCIYF